MILELTIKYEVTSMVLQMMFILFLGLKLANIITWSWWIVCLPIVVIVLRWMTQIFIKEAVKLKRPWAIKLITWINS